MTSTSDDSGLNEWQTARDILDKYDERLHDLRKVGFSFITGLLTVDALLTPNSESWKLAALVATLFLIVPLDLVDRNYRVFLTAASIRAQILERRSRMDLTQTITRMFEISHVGFFFETVYVVFALAVLLLGWIIFGAPASLEYWKYWFLLAVLSSLTISAARLSLWPGTQQPQQDQQPSGSRKWSASIVISRLSPQAKRVVSIVIIVVPMFLLSLWINPAAVLLLFQSNAPHYHLTLLAAVMIAVACILYIETTVHINEWVDFGIDGYEFEQGEEVTVMVSNLGHEKVNLSNKVWAVCREDSPEPRPPATERPHAIEPVIEAAELPGKSAIPGKVSWSDHRWLLPTKDLPPGLYRVIYGGPVYFRRGRFLRRHFELLDAEDKNDKDALTRREYNPWNDAAQRFRVLKKKDSPAKCPSEITVNLREKERCGIPIKTQSTRKA